jgi:hypothetical protein
MTTLSDLLRAEFGRVFEDVTDALPKHATLTYDQRPVTVIDKIVLHHTAVSRATTWEAVARYHVDGNGWPGIAYHVAVRQYDSQITVSLLNRPETRSYHAHTEGNNHGLALVLAGDFTTATPTVQEVDALRRIVAVVRGWASWAALPVVGHKDVPGNETTCPGAGLAATLTLLNAPDGLPLADDLRAAIWQAAKSGQAIAPNPGSAIEVFMAEEGYQPIGNERDVVVDGVWQGVAQLGYTPGYNAAGVAFFATNKTPGGDWLVWMVEQLSAVTQ